MVPQGPGGKRGVQSDGEEGAGFLAGGENPGNKAVLMEAQCWKCARATDVYTLKWLPWSILCILCSGKIKISKLSLFCPNINANKIQPKSRFCIKMIIPQLKKKSFTPRTY